MMTCNDLLIVVIHNLQLLLAKCLSVSNASGICDDVWYVGLLSQTSEQVALGPNSINCNLHNCTVIIETFFKGHGFIGENLQFHQNIRRFYRFPRDMNLNLPPLQYGGLTPFSQSLDT